MHAFKRRVAKYTSRLLTRDQKTAPKSSSRLSREDAEEPSTPSQARPGDCESQLPSDRNGYLAVELVLCIFDYLSPLEVLRCRAVSTLDPPLRLDVRLTSRRYANDSS